MIAYKFRSSAQLEFTLDIILNRRLYCASWNRLNDPMEGLFAYSHRGDNKGLDQFLDRVKQAKSGYKVCSLARNFQSHLMWSHYAGGFDGVAIEINLPDGDPNVRPVLYRGVFAFLNTETILDPDAAARHVLFSKYEEWKYEEEIRVLSDGEYYNFEQHVKRIIVGHRMRPSSFKILQRICENNGVEVYRVGIGDEGIDADYVEPLTTPHTDPAIRRR